MRIVGNLLLCCCAFCGVVSHAAETGAGVASNRPTATNRYVVMLDRKCDQDACAGEHGLQRRRIFRHAINGFVAELNPASLERLRKDKRVLSIVESRETSSSLNQVVPTGVRRMGVAEFPPVKIDGSDRRVDVDVAILDSGVQLDHPDLNVVNAVDVTWWPYGLVSSVNDHGTVIAGIIGALDNNFGVVGVAPGARIWSVRVSSDQGRLYTEDIMAAFNYVAQHAQEIEMVNCSFGSDYGYVAQGRNQYQAAIRALVNQGVVVVAAAGNDGADIAGPDGVLGSVWDDDRLPAALPEVMAVTAMTPQLDRMANFSDYSSGSHSTRYVFSPGGAIDVAAPGTGLTSTTLNSGYQGNNSGTSYACPHAVGLVALYIATHGRPTNAAGVYALRQAIVDAALPQSRWKGTNTFDPDNNPEGLAMAPLSWASNAPAMLNVITAASGANIRFGTATGYVHTVQSANTIGSNNLWADLAVTNGSGQPASIIDTNPAAFRFYRLSSQPVAWPQIEAFMATNLGSLGLVANGIYVATEHPTGGAIASEPGARCAEFSAENNGGHIEIPFHASLNPQGPFTIEFWLQMKQTLTYACPASSYDAPFYAPKTPQTRGWLIYQGNSSLSSGHGLQLVFTTRLETLVQLS
jgi:subtilisin